MKEELCKAFCDDLTVREVGAGLAVSTPFDGFNGEPIGFYIVRESVPPGYFHLEDDGTTIPMLEACGIDFASPTRSEAFAELISENGIIYDVDATVLKTQALPEDRIPDAARRFMAVLLRLQDFLLLTPERVASTFREDATPRMPHKPHEPLDGKPKTSGGASTPPR